MKYVWLDELGEVKKVLITRVDKPVSTQVHGKADVVELTRADLTTLTLAGEPKILFRAMLLALKD